MIAEKKGESYQHVISFVRTRLRFALLKATLIAIRGFKGKVNIKEVPVNEINFNLIPTISVAI